MYNKSANALGIPVKDLRRAMYYLEKRSNYRKHPDGRILMRLENRMALQIHSLFKKQSVYFAQRLANLTIFDIKGLTVITKDLRDEINEIFENDPYIEDIVSIIIAGAGIAALIGMKRETLVHPEIRPFKVDLQNEAAVAYMRAIENLHLSNFRGSIRRTTKENIVNIVADGLENAETYGQIADKIMAQSKSGVFSKARAKVIAVDQSTKAYSFGKKLQINEYIARTGAFISKFWSTVRDEKVSQNICAPNEAQGWIKWSEVFQSGDDMVPGHINCRCDIITRIDSV